jgi:co-chaperonin GroES (HSP10)
MAINLNTLNGTLRPIGNRVIVADMYFGEQKTKGGLILRDDNGSTRGIYPRWGKVHSKGPENKDDYAIGDWVLIEHGRWTRSVKINEGDGEKELRMVEAESILGYSNLKPDDVQIGAEYNDGQTASYDASQFAGAIN